MNRRRFVKTLTAFNATVGLGQADVSTRTGLVGTWRIVTYEDRAEGGKTSYPYGKHPIGLLSYDSSGHMSVQITKAATTVPVVRTKHRKPGSERPESAYTAYFGTYTVDWDRKVITHTVEGNLYPVFVGTRHERPFDLEGDRLEHKPQWMQEGIAYSGIRVFERLR